MLKTGGLLTSYEGNPSLAWVFQVQSSNHTRVTSCGPSVGRIVAIAKEPPGSKGPLPITHPQPPVRPQWPQRIFRTEILGWPPGSWP